RRPGAAERREVEGDAADDEEERDEEAEADRRQLRLEDLQLVPLQRQPHDHPGDEAAEQQVEPELRREEDEAEDEPHGEPHGELARGLEWDVEHPTSAA